MRHFGYETSCKQPSFRDSRLLQNVGNHQRDQASQKTMHFNSIKYFTTGHNTTKTHTCILGLLFFSFLSCLIVLPFSLPVKFCQAIHFMFHLHLLANEHFSSKRAIIPQKKTPRQHRNNVRCKHLFIVRETVCGFIIRYVCYCPIEGIVTLSILHISANLQKVLTFTQFSISGTILSDRWRCSLFGLT